MQRLLETCRILGVISAIGSAVRAMPPAPASAAARWASQAASGSSMERVATSRPPLTIEEYRSLLELWVSASLPQQ